MSTDAHASVGYGFKLPSSLTKQGDLEELLAPGLELMFSGDSFADDFATFIVIAKSEVGVYTWEGGNKKIDPAKMVADDKWDEKLQAWAKEHNIAKPKIGWWLCSSV